MPSGVYKRTEWHRNRLKVPRPGSGRKPSGLPKRKKVKVKKTTPDMRGRWERTAEHKKTVFVQGWDIEAKRWIVYKL